MVQGDEVIVREVIALRSLVPCEANAQASLFV